MIRRDNLPKYVSLTESHTTIKGRVKGISYQPHECFIAMNFLVIDETDFVSVVDSSGNETCLPAVILERAEICPWEIPTAV